MLHKYRDLLNVSFLSCACYFNKFPSAPWKVATHFLLLPVTFRIVKLDLKNIYALD